MKKSSYMLLLSEDEYGTISLLKLRRNFTYSFDAVIFGNQIDACYLYSVLSYLTKDELQLLLYLYESTHPHEKTYLQVASLDDYKILSEKFPNLFSYCGRCLETFCKKIEELKSEFKFISSISSHERSMQILVREIISILDSGYYEKNSKPLVYPGGRGRKDDKNFLETAIRETQEETNIHRDSFNVLKTKPFFRETYTSNDGIRYAQMFFLAKLCGELSITLEKIFESVVLVPIKDLTEEDILENTIKNIDFTIIKHVSPRDAKSYVNEILASKRFMETDIFRNYNTGKLIRDYKMSFMRYLAQDIF